jgi:MFS transporter, ACS family, hexuronate transporter
MTDRLASGNFLSGLRKQMAALTLLMFSLAVIPWQRSYALTLLLMFLTMFAGSGFTICAMSYATRVFSSERAGLIAGLGAGSWSLVVAVLAPLFGRMFDQRDYTTAFGSAAAVPVFGFLAFLWLSSRTVSSTRPS